MNTIEDSKNKTLPKEEKKYSPKMKKWDEDEISLVPFEQLISPLKSIINNGYNLFRKTPKSFDYEGYDIGNEDHFNIPPPNARLTEQGLDFENKRFGRNLIDVILHIAFLLGLEQGRRSKNLQKYQFNYLIEQLEFYKKENQDLRIKNDELEILLTNTDCPADLSKSFKDKKINRIKLLKSRTDKFYHIKNPTRTKFKELIKIMRSVDQKTTSPKQFKDILNANGWTQKQYSIANKK